MIPNMTSDMIANKLDKILAIVCSVFDAYSAVLFLPAEDRAEDLRLVSSFSLGNKILADAPVQPGSLVAWIQRDNPVILPNFDRNPTKLGYYDDGEEETIKAFMGCPIPTGGVLCVDSKRQYSFSDKDLKIIHLFAQLIASEQDGLVKQDLTGEIPNYFVTLGMMQDLRFRYRHWPDFIQNFLVTIAKASQFGYAAFVSVDRPGETYCLESESRPLLLQEEPRLYLPMGNGSIVGLLFRNGSDQIFATEGREGDTMAPLFGRDQNFPDFRAAICMPIMVNKNTKAVLCLADEGERRIDESLRSFVRLVADHLALFLENLYLKHRVRKMLPAQGEQTYPVRDQDSMTTGNIES